MRPGPGELLHFSEDPSITVFHPHLAPTARETSAYVWAVDTHHSPSYWFPRQCPRAMAWTTPDTDPADAARLLGPATTRVHVIEYDWLPALQTTTLYAYRLPAAAFHPIHEDGHAYVATTTVEPLGPAEPVGDLLTTHRDAAIELRLTTTLWPWWDEVITSTLAFSGIRLRNARPRP
ncbi:hypothetical protein HDA40_000339 [Hamadaea flava]|uniref:DUF6886 family protein n=1 Tax=Hamadaea flava TaxID=1742688 RepID=A0ABV8LU02_9ACTN|nr:DUF6886 family protein [Hamadaea flava]MCP2321832.1 hypothetical protein [Hamadaea flava]